MRTKCEVVASIYFLAVLLLISGCVSSGPTRGDYEYQKVTEVDASADEIYSRSRAWLAQQFVESDYAIQLEDDESRRVVANAGFFAKENAFTGGDLEFDLIVEAKDGRFRMSGRNYQIVASEQYDIRKPLTEELVDDVRAQMDSFRTDLKRHIASGKSDEW